jgi:hypothetical protein
MTDGSCRLQSLAGCILLHLCHRLILEIQSVGNESGRSKALQSLLLHGTNSPDAMEELSTDSDGIVLQSIVESPWSICCLDMLPNLYAHFANLPGGYQLGSMAILLGKFDFIRADEVIRLRREEERKKFVS